MNSRHSCTQREHTIEEKANEWWDNLCELDREEMLQRAILLEYKKRH
jgi:hypothetical protein